MVHLDRSEYYETRILYMTYFICKTDNITLGSFLVYYSTRSLSAFSRGAAWCKKEQSRIPGRNHRTRWSTLATRPRRKASVTCPTASAKTHRRVHVVPLQLQPPRRRRVTTILRHRVEPRDRHRTLKTSHAMHGPSPPKTYAGGCRHLKRDAACVSLCPSLAASKKISNWLFRRLLRDSGERDGMDGKHGWYGGRRRPPAMNDVQQLKGSFGSKGGHGAVVRQPVDRRPRLRLRVRSRPPRLRLQPARPLPEQLLAIQGPSSGHHGFRYKLLNCLLSSWSCRCIYIASFLPSGSSTDGEEPRPACRHGRAAPAESYWSPIGWTRITELVAMVDGDDTAAWDDGGHQGTGGLTDAAGDADGQHCRCVDDDITVADVARSPCRTGSYRRVPPGGATSRRGTRPWTRGWLPARGGCTRQSALRSGMSPCSSVRRWNICSMRWVSVNYWLFLRACDFCYSYY